MNEFEQTHAFTWIDGKRWDFPSRAVHETIGGRMAAEEEAIQDSLKVLFASLAIEQFINPEYGLDMHNKIFMPMGSVTKALLQDHNKHSILFILSRISLLSLELDTASEQEGKLSIKLEYIVRSTNSRNKLVFPFYRTDRSNVSTPAEFGNS